jgi:hypothetical protein
LSRGLGFVYKRPAHIRPHPRPVDREIDLAA